MENNFNDYIYNAFDSFEEFLYKSNIKTKHPELWDKIERFSSLYISAVNAYNTGEKVSDLMIRILKDAPNELFKQMMYKNKYSEVYSNYVSVVIAYTQIVSKLNDFSIYNKLDKPF